MNTDNKGFLSLTVSFPSLWLWVDSSSYLMFLRFRVHGIWVRKYVSILLFSFLQVRVETILIQDRRSNSRRNECSLKGDRIEAHIPSPSLKRSLPHGGSISWRYYICGFRSSPLTVYRCRCRCSADLFIRTFNNGATGSQPIFQQ